MKRLVICCDGTWKNADDQTVSNIEKIARIIETSSSTDVQQVVFYASGVGTGATRAEHILGGLFGMGLDQTIFGAYRFLALNFEPGDEIYVFGFSRGAYTARSLVGMIATVGLLKEEGVVANKLANAMAVYRNRPRLGEAVKPDVAQAYQSFRDQCYPNDQVRIKFLGVFDTVGALGVPGMGRKKFRFHDVALTPQVDVARHALAIDEQRRSFAPSLWVESANSETDVKQVWFEGVHSDIGGGYSNSAMSDLTLTWMIHEAEQCGLIFDISRLDLIVRPYALPLKANRSMNAVYAAANLMSRTAEIVRLRDSSASRFQHGRRVLEIRTHAKRDCNVSIAATAFDPKTDETVNRIPVDHNVKRWISWLRLDESVEPATRVEKLPWPAAMSAFEEASAP